MEDGEVVREDWERRYLKQNLQGREAKEQRESFQKDTNDRAMWGPTKPV